MSFLPYGVTSILKPIVSFTISSLSDMMTAAVIYGLAYIALADQISALLGAGR